MSFVKIGVFTSMLKCVNEFLLLISAFLKRFFVNSRIKLLHILLFSINEFRINWYTGSLAFLISSKHIFHSFVHFLMMCLKFSTK